MSDETRALTPEEMTANQLKAALGREKIQRQQACLQEIEKVLTQFRCILEAQVTIRGSQVQSVVAILAKE